MLVDYLFVDTCRLTNYAEQIGAQRSTRKLPTWKVGLAIGGPSVEGSQTTTEQPATTHELIKGIVSYLTKADLLLTSRPWSGQEIAESRTPFVLESMKARKVTFQCDQVAGLKGLRELGVWVSTPTVRPSELSASKKNPAVPKGMFLYLVEGYWESDGKIGHGASEFSALNHVLKSLKNAGVSNGEINRLVPNDDVMANAFASGGDSNSEIGSYTPYLPKEDFSGPLEVLKRAGGVVGEMRNIQALYRMREVSDNQFIMIGTSVHRTFDLFGYPIFIADGTGLIS
jgi:hypothetical protein